jgi:hypothetical protein
MTTDLTLIASAARSGVDQVGVILSDILTKASCYAPSKFAVAIGWRLRRHV